MLSLKGRATMRRASMLTGGEEPDAKGDYAEAGQ